MMIARADIAHFMNVWRSFASAKRVAFLLVRHALQRLSYSRGTSLVLGNALAARLLHSLLRLGVDLKTGQSVERLIVEGSAVRGVIGNGRTIRARRGVVIATGGFSHNRELRQRLVPPEAGNLSAAATSNTGGGIQLALAAGAKLEERADQPAFWTPVSCFVRADGSKAVFPHTVTDRAKPGVIAVNASAHRFVNEACSYHDFVRAMIASARAGPGDRVYLICDRNFLWRYGLGAVRPFTRFTKRWIDIGYLTKAQSLADLAAQLGLDGAVLAKTVAGFNEGAARGEDPEFGRGGNAYQRHLGDGSRAPNPCVAPIAKPPFYAVRLEPADLGTSLGLITDADARVLDTNGNPITGLYACGNDMNSVMNGAYPGPGITLGPAITFGYLAARHCLARVP
jgi:succinate dehydrogenase/fumarate reductase flavoprotein subunit